jgi:hypothetical protein
MGRRKGPDDETRTRLLKIIKAEHGKSRSAPSTIISARDQRLNGRPMRYKGFRDSSIVSIHRFLFWTDAAVLC